MNIMKNHQIKSLFITVLMLLCSTFSWAEGTAGKAKLIIEPFEIAAGSEAEMLISMSNPDDEVTLVQFDMALPEGLSIKRVDDEYYIDIAGRTTWKNHSLDAHDFGGSIRFLLASTKNSLISGTYGAVISVNIVADDNFKGGDIKLSNILIVNPDGKTESKPADCVYTIGMKQDVLDSGIEGNITWTLYKDGKLILSGNGAMNDYVGYPPYYKHSDIIKTIIVEDGITTIGANAFGSLGKVEVHLPNTITRIEKYAFYISFIDNIVIPNSVEVIGNWAFSLTNLESVVIPESVKSIGGQAFSFCDKLTSVTIGKNVEHIDMLAFWNCSALNCIY